MDEIGCRVPRRGAIKGGTGDCRARLLCGAEERAEERGDSDCWARVVSGDPRAAWTVLDWARGG